jgi:hypothetical protein
VKDKEGEESQEEDAKDKTEHEKEWTQEKEGEEER